MLSVSGAAKRRAGQWIVLLLLSALLTWVATGFHLPAALLLGPMIAGIGFGVGGASIRVPRYAFIAAQGVIGCMIGRSIPLSVMDDLLRDWPVFLAGVVSVMAAASAIGWFLTRRHFLPGTTAIWGISPGGSTPMILMSESYGADIRLVAIMHQLRVVSVALIATIIARLWGANAGGAASAIVWFPAVTWPGMLATVSLVTGGAVVATLLSIPGGQLLLPLAGSMLLHETLDLTVELPPWLLAGSYALVGWNIGLRFTRPTLAYAARALPRMLACIIGLIAACGLIAGGLAAIGIDPLTAYLATCPGGADSVAIIAASSNVDLHFVMAMQTARFIVALVTSPLISRVIAVRAADPSTS